MSQKNVLIIPDASQGSTSGAIVCQVATQLFVDLGCKVIVFAEDVKQTEAIDGICFVPRMHFSSRANIISSSYRQEFCRILINYNIDTIFFVGSITNKPLCYLEEAYKRKLKVIVKIFMQDFFCSKFYANDSEGICTKCLDNLGNALYNHCCGKGWRSDFATLNRIYIREHLKSLLPKADYVITSSDQQIGFYQKFGVPAEKCIKTPLYFQTKRFDGVKTKFGDYYVGIAQQRIEKGFHLLPRILKHCSNKVKMVLAYANQNQVRQAKTDPALIPFISSGQLIIKEASWKTGLLDLVANAKGVIIPSIWPTTTEFGLLEALTLQKCVFCFNVGIHGEVFINSVNGYAYSINQNIEFAEALNQFDECKYQDMLPHLNQLQKKLTDYTNWLQTLKSLL